MRILVQVFCVVAIAIGAGFLGFSNKLEPQQIASSLRGPDAAIIGPFAGGFGIGLLLLGILGLIMLWLNSIRATELDTNSARTISTIVIWLSIAIILTLGPFRLDSKDSYAPSAVIAMTVFIATAATINLAYVFGWEPWTRNKQSMVDSGRQET